MTLSRREIRRLAWSDARVVPWRNGRGRTHELAAWPGPEDFEWRLSIAPVDEPGPFSSFPGIERILTVIRGEGLVLAHGAEAPRARLRRLEPYRFDGAWPTTAELTRGPITDFNVMVRSGAACANVQALRLGRREARERLGAGHAFLHVLEGQVRARVTGEEEPFDLEAGASLWMRQLVGGEECDLRGTQEGTEALLVELGPGPSLLR